MILFSAFAFRKRVSKPRASGDDPYLLTLDTPGDP